MSQKDLSGILIVLMINVVETTCVILDVFLKQCCLFVLVVGSKGTKNRNLQNQQCGHTELRFQRASSTPLMIRHHDHHQIGFFFANLILSLRRQHKQQQRQQAAAVHSEYCCCRDDRQILCCKAAWEVSASSSFSFWPCQPMATIKIARKIRKLLLFLHLVSPKNEIPPSKNKFQCGDQFFITCLVQ